MKDPVVIAIWAYTLITVLSIFGAVLAVKRSHRKTEMDLEHQRQRIKNNELLWAENTELKQKLEALRKELDQAQESFRQQFDLRQTANAKVLELQQSLEAAEKERDQARALANDLREYLDRALKIVNEQNEQIQQLTPVEHRKHSVRGKDGRFVRKVATPYFVVKEVREVCEAFEKGAQSVASVAENIAKAFERLKPLNATQTPKVVDEHGNDLRKHPRPISSLKENEAILVRNEAERDGILKLMEAEGLTWINGSLPFKYTPNIFPNWIGLSNFHIAHKCDRREHILPASDFLPAERPAVEVHPTEAERPDDSHVGEQSQPAEQEGGAPCA